MLNSQLKWNIYFDLKQEFGDEKFVLLRFWYLYRARSGIWKTSRHLKNTRVTHNERKYQTSVNLTGMSSVDVEFQDVPFKVTKCDQILAYIVIGSIFVGFIFCILYGYYLTFLDAKDGKISKNDLRRFRPIKFNTWMTTLNWYHSWMCSIKFLGPLKISVFFPSFLPVLAWKTKNGKFHPIPKIWC